MKIRDVRVVKVQLWGDHGEILGETETEFTKWFWRKDHKNREIVFPPATQAGTISAVSINGEVFRV